MAERVQHVIFFHGMLGSPGSFESWMKKEGVAALRAGHLSSDTATHFLSLPGHGPSPWGTDLSSFDAVIDALAARLPIGRLGLVGYSLGARVALALALRRDVAWAVAIGAHLGIEDDAERAERRMWDCAMAHIARTAGMPALVEAWEALPVFATQAPDVVAEQRTSRLAHDPGAIAWAFETLGTGSMPPLAAALAARRVPIHLVAGAMDAKFTALARTAAPRVRASVHIVPGAGHNVVLEAPRALAQTFSEILSPPIVQSSRGPS